MFLQFIQERISNNYVRMFTLQVKYINFPYLPDYDQKVNDNFHVLVSVRIKATESCILD